MMLNWFGHCALRLDFYFIKNKNVIFYLILFRREDVDLYDTQKPMATLSSCLLATQLIATTHTRTLTPIHMCLAFTQSLTLANERTHAHERRFFSLISRSLCFSYLCAIRNDVEFSVDSNCLDNLGRLESMANDWDSIYAFNGAIAIVQNSL